MRSCTRCKKQDAPRLDMEASCRGKCDPRATEDVATHADNCPRMTHEVVLYYKLVKQADLIRTEEHPEGRLPLTRMLEGWKLVRDGRDQFRVKMLCRDCISLEVQREQSQREYETKCALLAGKATRTYSEMLVQMV